MDNAAQLLAALKAMRAAYGQFYRGNVYITVAYEQELKRVNRIADQAIQAAEQTLPNASAASVAQPAIMNDAHSMRMA